MRAANAIWLPGGAELGSNSLLLTARARRHFVREFAGPLSIKAVLQGRAAWKTAGRETWADPSAFLVLNSGEPYSMELDSREPVTTCCVFFEDDFVETVARDLSTPGERLLDEPGRPGPLRFVSRLHPDDGGVIPAMIGLRRRALDGADGLEIEEHLLLLSRRLLRLHGEVRRQMARISAAKASTREEMLRRVSRVENSCMRRRALNRC